MPLPVPEHKPCTTHCILFAAPSPSLGTGEHAPPHACAGTLAAGRWPAGTHKKHSRAHERSSTRDSNTRTSAHTLAARLLPTLAAAHAGLRCGYRTPSATRRAPVLVRLGGILEGCARAAQHGMLAAAVQTAHCPAVCVCARVCVFLCQWGSARAPQPCSRVGAGTHARARVQEGHGRSRALMRTHMPHFVWCMESHPALLGPAPFPQAS